jgi:exonuclease III
MRISTWNVCTLYRGGAVNELAKYLEKYTIDICAVQEIGWSGKVTVVKKKIM